VLDSLRFRKSVTTSGGVADSGIIETALKTLDTIRYKNGCDNLGLSLRLYDGLKQSGIIVTVRCTGYLTLKERQ
jgi:hypothetical protein